MGRLIWLIGASGSGKDSLLMALRQREPEQLLVAHRYITRAANAGGENHIALSEQEFLHRSSKDLFALSWFANHCYYGVGIEIDHWLQSGVDVVVNGSRAALPQALERYAPLLLPVFLQVSPEILRERLEARGRENPTQIAQRLERAERYAAVATDCIRLNNNGSLTQSVDDFFRLIREHAFYP